MKTKFSKSVSIFLSIVLVISVLASPNIFNVSADGELPTEVTRKLITEADNDYQTSAALTAPYATHDNDSIYNWFLTKGGQKYSGTIVPTYDPLDTTGENKVLRHREYSNAIGIIRLGDEYASPTTTGGINAEVGKTYKVNFKWMTEGYSTRTAVEFGIGLATADYADEVNYANDIDSNNVKVLKTIANHSNGTNKWEEMTAYFEVTSDMAETIKTYPQLVIWVKGGGKWVQGNADGNGYGMCTYFDDITVTSLAKYTETIYAENDFSTANYGNVTQGSAWKYRGASFVGVDPDDADNKVVENRAGYKDLGVIYLNDTYTSNLPKNFIKATAGTTYTISFKWKYNGTQKSGVTRIGVGLAQTSVDGDDGSKYTVKDSWYPILEKDSKQVVATVDAGTYENIEWKTETIRFTVPADSDLVTYPNLVLYTQNTNTASGISYYFDDITVKSLPIIEPETFVDESIVNDYSDASTTLAYYGQKRGSIKAMADPDNETNRVLRAGYPYDASNGQKVSYIFPGDKNNTINPVAGNCIPAEAGKTYYISFKWKAQTDESIEITEENRNVTNVHIGVGNLPNSNGGISGICKETGMYVTQKLIDNANTYNQTEWNIAKVEYTIPQNADITSYPYIVFQVLNESYAQGQYIYFDDITVSTEIAAATVNFVYEGNVANNFTTVKESVYFEDGNILDYQPEELPVGVKWYIDEMCTEEYDFTKDYTEYMDITLYGVSQYAKGDINADGSINARDIVLMQQCLLEIITGTIRFYDINSDNEVDILDLVILKMKMVYPKANELSSITLSLYEKEGDTYTYGIAWQSDVQLSQPVVEIMQADESDWANAKRIVGNASNSVSHQTFQIKEGWNYNTISDDYKAAGGTGAWYHSGITMSHDINVIYSNKLLINGLSAGQSYKYRVGDAFNKKYSGEGIFTAYNGANSGFKFIYMADSQQSFASSNVNAWSNTLNAAFTSMNDAEFIAMGGDLINWNAIEAQWKGLLDYNKNYVMNIPIMPTAGNHEINMTASGTGIEYGDFNSHFNLPYNNDYDDEINSVGDFKSTAKPQHFVNGATGAYYSYDYKNVHFVVLNTNDIYISHRDRTDGKYVLGDAQMAWLNADLAAAKQREENGEIDFTIVYMHAGLYTTGAAGLGGDYKETYDLYDQLQSVFADNGVDIVLSGHDHVYSCTKMLDRNGDVVETGGVVYMTGGVAGVNGPSASRFYTGEVAKDVNEALLYNTTNDVSKYDCGLIDEKYNNCWTEFNVTADKITVTTYSNDLKGGYIDKFEISNNQKTVIS